MNKFLNFQYIFLIMKCVFKEEARKAYLDASGKVDLVKVQARWNELAKVKQSLGGKFFTAQVVEKLKTMSEED